MIVVVVMAMVCDYGGGGLGDGKSDQCSGDSGGS